MNLPQVANARNVISLPGRGLRFGAQVPSGLALSFDGHRSISVTPGLVVHWPFQSFTLDWPNKVSEDDLNLVVIGQEPELVHAWTSRAVSVGSGQETLASSASRVIDLPPMGHLAGGAPRGLQLVGALSTTGTTGLPSGLISWASKFGQVPSFFERFKSTGTLSYFKFQDKPYPQDGGQLTVLNGTTSRTLTWALFAVLA